MTTLPALAVKHPKFGDAFLGGQRHAQQTEMNALGMETRKLQNKGIQRDHAIQSLRLVGGMALGAKNGDPNGEVDPEKYAQMRELLKNKFGMEISEDPSSADSLFRSSLTAMQQVGMAKDERAVAESLRRWDIANQRANRAEGRAGEMHRLKVEQMRNPKIDPTSGMKDYEYATSNGYQGSYADWKKINNPGTTVNIGNQDISKIKEGPAKAAGFYERMQKASQETDAIKNVDPAAGRNTVKGFWQNIAPNEFQSPEFQAYKTSSAEWIRAKLRKESGAVIGADEMRQEFETYFPQPGDSEKTVELKKRLRATAEQAMQAESRGAHDALFPEQDGWTVRVKK